MPQPCQAASNAGQMLSGKSIKAMVLLVSSRVRFDRRQPCRGRGCGQAAGAGRGDEPVQSCPEYADVILPVRRSLPETSGTFVNAKAVRKASTAWSSPLGETRPAWKVLRVLAMLGLDFSRVRASKPSGPALGDAVALPGGHNNAGRHPSAGRGACRNWPTSIYAPTRLVRRSPRCRPRPTPGSVASLPRCGPNWAWRGAQVKVSPDAGHLPADVLTAMPGRRGARAHPAATTATLGAASAPSASKRIRRCRETTDD